MTPDYSLVSWSFPSRAVVEGLWLRFQGEQVEVCVRRERRRRILQTLVWFIVTLILALFIPDIGRVISLIGGLAACFIFVFPGNAFCIFFVGNHIVLPFLCHTVTTVCRIHPTGLCLMQAKLSETDDRSARWGATSILIKLSLTSSCFFKTELSLQYLFNFVTPRCVITR